ASRDYVDAIKIELEFKIETLKEELKALINTKEDKGVAANLDKALKTELTKLINKKENTGTAASLDAQLRDELIALINKKENIGVAKQLVDALRSELTNKINSSVPKLTIKTVRQSYSRKGVHEFYLNGVYQDQIISDNVFTTNNNF
ncbi:hypothetical protein D4A77_09235, partial [Campylobacter coli]|nr:hypothetical protein [Campylobacter coli]